MSDVDDIVMMAGNFTCENTIRLRLGGWTSNPSWFRRRCFTHSRAVCCYKRL